MWKVERKFLNKLQKLRMGCERRKCSFSPSKTYPLGNATPTCHKRGPSSRVESCTFPPILRCFWGEEKPREILGARNNLRWPNIINIKMSWVSSKWMRDEWDKINFPLNDTNWHWRYFQRDVFHIILDGSLTVFSIFPSTGKSDVKKRIETFSFMLMTTI